MNYKKLISEINTKNNRSDICNNYKELNFYEYQSSYILGNDKCSINNLVIKYNELIKFFNLLIDLLELDIYSILLIYLTSFPILCTVSY